MLSPLMLIVIFLEISIAIITSLGGMLVAVKYIKGKRLQDLYVSFILLGVAAGDICMLIFHIAYNLQLPFAELGFKFFIYSLEFVVISIWLHLSEIYGFKSRALTVIFSILLSLSALLVMFSNVDVIMNEGVIVPMGMGLRFAVGFSLLAGVVAVESVFSIFGLRKLRLVEWPHYWTSKTAGLFLLILFSCLTTYIFTKIIYFWVLTWFFAFFSMLFLFLFTMIPEDSPIAESPFNFFRTRILFKLVITLILMIVISLQGMGLISINIAKRALSNSIIQGYINIAEDTISLINKTRIDTSSEQTTLAGISKILDGTKIGARGSVFLISPSKNVYINRAHTWVSLGNGQANVIDKIINDNSMGGDIELFGEKVVAADIPIKKLGWHMIVGQQMGYAYERIKMMEGTYIIFILLWIAATTVVGVVFARNIEEPIKVLKTGIEKISEGDLDHRIIIDKIDELGDLANTLNTMTKELKDTQDSLLRSERLAALGYMAAGMAHEIKNALVPLRTLTELMKTSGGDKIFVEKFNELVPREIERINMLSTDLLHYSRPAEPVFEYVDPNEIVLESAKFLEIQARKKGITIKHDLPKVSEISADKQKLMEACTNIILNAIEAMDGGNIRLSTQEKDDSVIISIADNGPGIPEGSLKKIFVPFFTTKKEGTGMGLAITQRVIADHGGKIDIQSMPGMGTTFFLSFPRKA